MPPPQLRWLRERLENDTIYSDGGIWKYVALLVGFVIFLGMVIVWLWRNLADFR